MRNPIEVINQEIDSSLGKLSEEEMKHYIFLITELHKRNVSRDENYQNTYKRYFNLRMTNPNDILNYFNLLQQYKNEMMTEHSPAVIAMQFNRVEFSFATKLCHVIHPETFIIYDQNVLGVLFGLNRPYHPDRNERLQRYLHQHFLIRAAYIEILSNPALLIRIKDHFFRKFNIAACQISTLKMIDFILWKAGSKK